MKTKELEKKAQDSGLIKSSVDPVQGVEGLSGKHLAVASIVLVQGTSAHLVKAGVLPGRFASTLTTSEVKDTKFVPAYMTEKLFVYKYLDPGCNKKEFEFVATSDADTRLDGRRTAWEEGKKPEVIPTIILAAIMGGKPVKVSFRNASGYNAGKKLWSFAYDAAKENGTPLWGVEYKLVAVSKKNKQGIEYYAFDIERVGVAADADQAEAAMLSAAFKSQAELHTQEVDDVAF